MIQFNKENVAELSLSMLKETVLENDCQGKPLMGIHHFELLDRSLELLDKQNLKWEIANISAIQNNNKQRPGATLVDSLALEYGSTSPKAHILRRLFTKINLLDYYNDEVIRNMVFVYTQDGIQVAFGQNVKVCSNLTIFGADNLVSTYASLNERVGINKIFDVMPNWLNNIDSSFQKDLNTIEQFKNISVNINQLEELIGTLTLERINRDVYKGKTPIALNQGQISQFAESIIPMFKSKDDIVDVWSIYNKGTELHKCGKNDVPILLENNITWGDVLIREFINHN